MMAKGQTYLATLHILPLFCSLRLFHSAEIHIEIRLQPQYVSYDPCWPGAGSLPASSRAKTLCLWRESWCGPGMHWDWNNTLLSDQHQTNSKQILECLGQGYHIATFDASTIILFSNTDLINVVISLIKLEKIINHVDLREKIGKIMSLILITLKLQRTWQHIHYSASYSSVFFMLMIMFYSQGRQKHLCKTNNNQQSIARPFLHNYSSQRAGKRNIYRPIK